MPRLTSTFHAAVCAAALAAVPHALAAQAAVIVGRVVDTSDRPLAGATVLFEDTEIESRTDADGAFALRIDFVDSGVVTIRKVGYAPAQTSVHLARGDTARVVARLASSVVLDTVRATASGTPPSARLAAFETRRTRGQGLFITRDEIERRRPITVADMIRWSGAVSIIDSLGSVLPVSRRGTKNDRTRRTFDAPCVMRIAIDGIAMPDGFSLTQLPAPQEIAGVEIYRGPASMPAEFSGMRSGAFCGLVAVWTRSR